ncbi:FadR/GntR family transcriptional regulator [Compostibacter hankyongensis]|uniref:GntR family transcriptional regulator n=1 Tax=Compostibacter hankyongensis TaxID=1007089 RepID=A0ABP8G271_9BACT
MIPSGISLQRPSLADKVVGHIQRQISLGEYRSGEKLPSEHALMAYFKVGRSTVREAVKILVQAGIVRVKHGVGIFVQPAPELAEPLSRRLKRVQVSNVQEVKLLLEMKIAEKAALHRTEKDISRMRKFLEKRRKAALSGQYAVCVQADIDFHISIAEASGNDILADLYKAFAKELKSYFDIVYEASLTPFAETYALHAQLMESIIARKPEEAWSLAGKISNWEKKEEALVYLNP